MAVGQLSPIDVALVPERERRVREPTFEQISIHQIIHLIARERHDAESRVSSVNASRMRFHGMRGRSRGSIGFENSFECASLEGGRGRAAPSRGGVEIDASRGGVSAALWRRDAH